MPEAPRPVENYAPTTDFAGGGSTYQNIFKKKLSIRILQGDASAPAASLVPGHQVDTPDHTSGASAKRTTKVQRPRRRG